MKRIIGILLISLMTVCMAVGVSFACDDCDNPDVVATATPLSVLNGDVISTPSHDMAGGSATGINVTLEGYGEATGIDTYNREFVVDYYKWGFWPVGHYENVLVPGTAEVHGTTELDLTSNLFVLSKGEKLDGLSFTYAKNTAVLDITAEVWAKGNDGCTQEAWLDIEGDIASNISARSFSGAPIDYSDPANPVVTGPYAAADGSGYTVASIAGHEEDYSSYGGFCSPNKAFVDFDSTLKVKQDIFTASYVSKDGLTAGNFATIKGGDAGLYLGRDGFLGLGTDNIELTGIKSSGQVSQKSLATDGMSTAFGGSYAFFKNANGTVNPAVNFALCGPNQTANGTGQALVFGYNKITKTPTSLNVKSVQYAKSTTGNTQPVQAQCGDN